jgi:hypothetical protein
MKKQITTSIVLTAMACAAPAFAQDTAIAIAPPPVVQAPVEQPAPPPRPAAPVNLAEMRHHIYVMEGALARAVDYGAKQLNRQILQVMPGVFMLEGEARARGVHLDSYGVFFDVRVPMMRQSMVWSLRMMLDQDDAANQQAINDIRKYMEGITDPATRQSLEKSVSQLERQSSTPALTRNQPVGPGIVMPSSAITPSGAAMQAGMATAPPAQLPAADSMWAKDPNRAYTEAVTRALVDAMIDYSTPMNIAPDQYLTVAARDDEGRDSLAPQDPLDEVVTMIYRIKGRDLQAYRAGQIDRDEVRKRVEITQF